MATTVIDPKVSAKPTENLKLQISRVIRASRQRAFDAWTRPEYIRQWFGGNSRSVASIEADVRESGAYCFKVSGGTGPSEGSLTESDMARDASISGRYVEVNPYDLLSFTWVGNWVLRKRPSSRSPSKTSAKAPKSRLHMSASQANSRAAGMRWAGQTRQPRWRNSSRALYNDQTSGSLCEDCLTNICKRGL